MKYIYRIIFCFITLINLSYSADHYVRAGANGNGSGSDWTNAFTSFPPTLIRGDTYYIADGSYGGYTFDDGTSGTTLITLKKATESDHGTETGWISSYGDGQASFGPLSFETRYWVFDGSKRTTNKTGYGFYIYTGANVTPSSKGIRLNGSGNITVKYTEIAGHGADTDGGGNDLIYASQAVSNVTFQYCLFYDAGRTHLLTRGGSNWLLEYCVLWKCESHSTEHSESWSCGRTSDVVIRYCYFQETDGTCILATLDNDPGPDNWKIYGNVFWKCDSNDGAIGTDSESSWTNVLVYNNVFVDGTGYDQGVKTDQGGGDTWQVYNNIWYNNNHVGFNSGIPHDYNAFYDSGSQSETHIQNLSGDIFVDYSNGNFRLTEGTNAGYSLNNPYNSDPDGNTRSFDGIWDRGAYEYNGDHVQLKTPQGLTIKNVKAE